MFKKRLELKNRRQSVSSKAWLRAWVLNWPSSLNLMEYLMLRLMFFTRTLRKRSALPTSRARHSARWWGAVFWLDVFAASKALWSTASTFSVRVFIISRNLLKACLATLKRAKKDKKKDHFCYQKCMEAEILQLPKPLARKVGRLLRRLPHLPKVKARMNLYLIFQLPMRKPKESRICKRLKRHELRSSSSSKGSILICSFGSRSRSRSYPFCFPRAGLRTSLTHFQLPNLSAWPSGTNYSPESLTRSTSWLLSKVERSKKLSKSPMKSIRMPRSTIRATWAMLSSSVTCQSCSTILESKMMHAILSKKVAKLHGIAFVTRVSKLINRTSTKVPTYSSRMIESDPMKKFLQVLHLKQLLRAKTRRLLLLRMPRLLKVTQLELMSRTKLKKMK